MKENDDSVTIVIPVYNGERFLERTLLSASNQTHSNIEILVIDDGSTDRTPEILKAMGEKIANLTTKRVPNNGVARARNLGTSLAKSKYVAYLDADDLWHPTKIEKQIASLVKKDPSEGWVASYTLFRSINKDDQVVVAAQSERKRGSFFVSHFLYNHVGNGSNILIERAVALEVGGFRPLYHDMGIGGAEDYDFQLRVLQKYRMELVDECLVGYRSYAGGMSSGYAKMARSCMEVWKQLSDDDRITDRVREIVLASTCAYAASLSIRGNDWPLAFRIVARGLRAEPLVFCFRFWRMTKFTLFRRRRILIRRCRRAIRYIFAIDVVTKPREFYSFYPTESIKPYEKTYSSKLNSEIIKSDLEFEKKYLN